MTGRRAMGIVSIPVLTNGESIPSSWGSDQPLRGTVFEVLPNRLYYFSFHFHEISMPHESTTTVTIVSVRSRDVATRTIESFETVAE